MHPCSSHAIVLQHSSIADRKPGTKIISLRLVWRCSLLMAMLATVVGCTGGPKRETKHVDVTGRVLFRGTPLPGGEVTFVAADGGFANTGRIDENGNYKINAPVGQVRIAVNNSMMMTSVTSHGKGMGAGRAPNAPQQAEPEPLKGKYVPIDRKYGAPETSGLTYEVKSEPNQTHDIELN